MGEVKERKIDRERDKGESVKGGIEKEEGWEDVEKEEEGIEGGNIYQKRRRKQGGEEEKE